MLKGNSDKKNSDPAVSLRPQDPILAISASIFSAITKSYAIQPVNQGPRGNFLMKKTRVENLVSL
jgi:hypothetical protein